MTTYAIGSVKGNYQLLLKLLDKIQFDPENDCLWFTGNLVNEGPESLAVLRFVKDLGKKAVTVLGNQEMYLLALAEGFEHTEAGDTLDELLNAPDRDELLKWLRRRSFIHHDSKLNFTLVHAGIPVEWSFSQALTFSYEVESVLSMNNYIALLENRQRDQSRWSAKLRGWRRLRFIVNAFTLIKYYKEPGRLDFDASGAIASQEQSLLPWYRSPDRLTHNLNIIFADDANFEDDIFPGVYPLPAQENLSALKLAATPERISVACSEVGCD